MKEEIIDNIRFSTETLHNSSMMMVIGRIDGTTIITYCLKETLEDIKGEILTELKRKIA